MKTNDSMKRMRFILLLVIACVITACVPKKKDVGNAEISSSEVILLTGGNGNTSEETIKVFSFNEEDGTFTYLNGLSGVSNPTFLTHTDDQRFIYAVKEDGGESAGAYAIAFNRENGEMRIMNEVSTQGGNPCNITLDPSERFVLTANYFGGNVTVMGIGDEGKLIDPAFTIPFTGKSVDPQRQTKPYLHCVKFSPDGKYMMADDLGTDRIHVFPVNEKAQKQNPQSLLEVDKMKDVIIEPGNGPRHLIFHPQLPYAYLINELSGNVVVFDYKDGGLLPKQYVAADTCNAKGSADIHISPDGKFLYASNRLKADGIAIFRISSKDGTLQKVGYELTGIHPRNFALTPNGKYVLVACRDSHYIQIFKRNVETGLLFNTGNGIEMKEPMFVLCLKK